MPAADGAIEPHFVGVFVPFSRDPLQWVSRLEDVCLAGAPYWTGGVLACPLYFSPKYLVGGLGSFASYGELLPVGAMVAGNAATPLACLATLVLNLRSVPSIFVSAVIVCSAVFLGVRARGTSRLPLVADMEGVSRARRRSVAVRANSAPPW